MEENISEAVRKALEAAPERNFVESIEMAFTIKDVDLKNPANRIEENVRLPRGRGKEVNIAMFASGEAASKAKDAGLDVIEPTQIEDLGGDRQKARKLARKYDFFLSEVPHMALIGRYLGIVLGPRGKMPRPVPPNVDPGAIANGLSNTAIVRSRDKVTFHTIVGTRAQSTDDITLNAMEMWKRVTSKL
tara:strand:- start:41 stop:607 length:567 start_codon:yes stop_codon:yes gene_type:complete